VNFSGSYDEAQVSFVVKLIQEPDFISIADKERHIQAGIKHYGEMLSFESLPSDEYMEIFRNALDLNADKMARHCLILANEINKSRSDGIVTLVSLMRAGTPIGVILRDILIQVFGREVIHYSISIIRDKGVDHHALSHILESGSPDKSFVFVDGWTGKGVITKELNLSVNNFNKVNGTAIDPSLFVLADIAGSAFFSATGEDYLIPSCILNSTISGLVSRSLLTTQDKNIDFHSCYFYKEYLHVDESKPFASLIFNRSVALFKAHGISLSERVSQDLRRVVLANYLKSASEKYSITDMNLIKPGIGEATRVLLRRVPKRLIVQDQESPDVAHLLSLARSKTVPIEINPTIPFKAVSLIGSSLDG